ncbi:DUF6475 domain-containing protein [Desulfovibrio sp.]|uniref:DUF6475 domain-containing protein n=1 Tax=Desulfovibrio sp. TaxID=885 RepID=UPI0025BDFE27|nr:DUF6475 domain-containing protein [Desulfovibrio sp.]
MTQADFDRFDVLMQGVAECYGQTLSAQGVALRFKLLEPFSLLDVEKAALSIMSSRKYTSMPVPADFLEHIGGGAAEDKAEVEAGKVLDAIGRHGAYSSVVFDDAMTQAVIVQAYGGWPKLCVDCVVEESEHWFRKNFAKTWAAYARQGVQCNGYLPGIIEISNYSNGFYEHIDPPKLIGDPAKARAVLDAGKSVLMLSESPENARGEIRPLSGLLAAVTDAGGQ